MKWTEYLSKMAALATLWILAAPAAFATTGGTSMPWDEPLIRIQENLTGPVASAIIIIAVALAGVMWALEGWPETLSWRNNSSCNSSFV